ncbi:hypothetical protein FQK01_24230, partial [Xanthomonas vasicola]
MQRVWRAVDRHPRAVPARCRAALSLNAATLARTPQQTARHACIRHNAPRMHATSAPDFRLYPSNALDTLAAL